MHEGFRKVFIKFIDTVTSVGLRANIEFRIRRVCEQFALSALNDDGTLLNYCDFGAL
jgi:hypothetical protein